MLLNKSLNLSIFLNRVLNQTTIAALKQSSLMSIQKNKFERVSIINIIQSSLKNSASICLNKNILSYNRSLYALSSLYKFSTQKTNNHNQIFKLNVIDIKNNHILILQDKQSILSYLKQVKIIISKEGQNYLYKGVVIKIQNNKSYIGLYENLSEIDLKAIQLDNNRNSLQKQNKNIKVILLNNSLRSINLPSYTHCIINANNQIKYLSENTTNQNQKTNWKFNKIKILSQQQQPLNKQQKKIQFVHNSSNKRRKLQSTSLILNTCYDLYYGDMLIFEGGIGSGRTKQVQNLMKNFISHENNHNCQNNHIAIYVNINKRQCQKFIKNIEKSGLSAQNYIIFTQENPTNTSSYALSIKAIQTAKKLSQKGYNILIAIDGYKQLLVHQWSLLTGINSTLLPISLTNQLHSNSIDNQRILNKNTSKPLKKGSLTSIVICQNSDLYSKVDIQNIQQLSMYSNTIKHLLTMNTSIKFPLDFVTNHNSIKNKIKKTKNAQQQQQLSENQTIQDNNSNMLFQTLRKNINLLISHKKQYDIKSKLGLIKDQPWQHYFYLDSKWWTTGLKNYQPISIEQRNQFILFIIWNIQQEISSQWNKSCVQIFKEYKKFVIQRCKDNIQSQKNNQQAFKSIYRQLFTQKEVFDEFLSQCKFNQLLEPFKKDYLP